MNKTYLEWSNEKNIFGGIFTKRAYSNPEFIFNVFSIISYLNDELNIEVHTVEDLIKYDNIVTRLIENNVENKLNIFDIVNLYKLSIYQKVLIYQNRNIKFNTDELYDLFKNNIINKDDNFKIIYNNLKNVIKDKGANETEVCKVLKILITNTIPKIILGTDSEYFILASIDTILQNLRNRI